MSSTTLLVSPYACPAVAEPTEFVHLPVLRAEVTELFAGVPAGVIVDATLGGGGHSEAILERSPQVQIIGLDRDPDAIAAATARLSRFGVRFTAIQARFDDGLRMVASDALTGGTPPVVGVLFDLGVSSPQLDRGQRGFSYRTEAALDMRMDPTSDLSAADVVNTYDVETLAQVLREYGDERFAHRVARAIVAARPVTGTISLSEIVRAAIPAATRRRGGHPARRTFQALRIEVNDELRMLEGALVQALALVAPGGRVVAISYHSGEDRRVKAAFRHAMDGGCTCPPGLPCACGAKATARNMTRGGVTPTVDECAENPRATSARLRAVEVLP